jgi:hypothetical protein
MSDTATLPAPASPPPASSGALLTVVGQAVHQSGDAEPAAAEFRFERRLLTSEQPFVRRCQVGEQWQPLPQSWLAEASYMVIANERPTFAVNPTAEQQAEADARVVEIGFVPPLEPLAEPRTMHSPARAVASPFDCILVRPGEQQPLTPSSLARVRLRCRTGAARCVVTLFPE